MSAPVGRVLQEEAMSVDALTGDYAAAGLASGSPEALARATEAAVEEARAGIERFKAGAAAGPPARLDLFYAANAALSNLRELVGMIAKAQPDEAVRTAA